MTGLNRVMHVEDDPSIRAIAKIAIETVGGLTLLSCASGEEALQKVQDFSPELILLDVMMPGMDGPSTLARLATLVDLGKVPVLFMTAKVQSSEIAALLALGAAGVVTKPFDPMQLADDLRHHWSIHRAIQGR